MFFLAWQCTSFLGWRVRNEKRQTASLIPGCLPYSHTAHGSRTICTVWKEHATGLFIHQHIYPLSVLPSLSSLAFSSSEAFSPWHPGYSNSLFRGFLHWPVHTTVGMSLHMSLSHSFSAPLRPHMALFIPVWHSEPFDSFPNLHGEAPVLQLVNTLFWQVGPALLSSLGFPLDRETLQRTDGKPLVRKPSSAFLVSQTT